MEQTHRSGVRAALEIGIRVLVAACPLAVIACSQPTSPSGQPDRATQAAPQSTTSGIRAENSSHLTPSDLVANGWACRITPTGDRYICSHPNQGFPVFGVPPPADRPSTFTFLTFGLTGNFIGTEILIRTDLYSGQPCESTGQPYILRAAVGYYECVHTAGN